MTAPPDFGVMTDDERLLYRAAGRVFLARRFGSLRPLLRKAWGFLILALYAKHFGPPEFVMSEARKVLGIDDDQD